MREQRNFIYHYTERYTFDERLKGKWVISRYGGTLWFFATFDDRSQLDRFVKTVGCNYKLFEKTTGLVYYECDRHFVDSPGGGFWDLKELPKDAKLIKALSNGSIVDCYFTNDGKTIKFYRPNPNAKNVYKPLPLKEHIEYQKQYGVY